MFPAFVSAQNFDFDAQKINRHIRLAQARHAHGVFFGRDDHLQIAPHAAINEALHLRLGVTMVIDITFRQLDAGA